MAKSPKNPPRDPAKHSKKDPAKPTRAKASRPDSSPMEPSLADLLNPAIGQGTAGVGAQTGLEQKPETSGLKPPPDNSFDRRADFSAAHRARKSTKGFDEAPQSDYVGEDAERAGDHQHQARGSARLPHAGRRGRRREHRAVRRHRHRAGAGQAAARGPRRIQRPGRGDWTPHRPPRPEKSEGGVRLVIKSDFEPKGDQPQAIDELVEGVKRHDRTQVLLGVTGSGKTFTMAKVIEATQRPALILAPNKTLAAQLYGEFKSFFPDNAVEYFVSYYDYYQPEAYVPRTDTYIEKESSINEQIDRMRHSATRALLERDDVIIVASVSCIYGIGSVETYSAMTFTLKQRRAHRPAPADRRPGRAAIQAHRRRFLPRHVPGARRHHRHLPGALRGPRLARQPVRRRDRE